MVSHSAETLNPIVATLVAPTADIELGSPRGGNEAHYLVALILVGAALWSASKALGAAREHRQ